MKYDPKKHHRRSIRLKGYDYSQAGAYFVTICANKRTCLFGGVFDRQIRLNDAGRMVKDVWEEIPIHYSNIELDAFVIMPNHIHGIINIVGAGPCACPDGGEQLNIGQPQGVAPTGLSLPNIIHRFKTMTTKRYIDGIKNNGWPPFHGRVWQRNYYEHIIRNNDELKQIREYIMNNPLKWEFDRENPDVVGAQHVRPLHEKAPWSI